jgi:hypothetical protein
MFMMLLHRVFCADSPGINQLKTATDTWDLKVGSRDSNEEYLVSSAAGKVSCTCNFSEVYGGLPCACAILAMELHHASTGAESSL